MITIITMKTMMSRWSHWSGSSRCSQSCFPTTQLLVLSSPSQYFRSRLLSLIKINPGCCCMISFVWRVKIMMNYMKQKITMKMLKSRMRISNFVHTSPACQLWMRILNLEFCFFQLANFGLNGYFILVVFSFYQVFIITIITIITTIIITIVTIIIIIITIIVITRSWQPSASKT